MKPQIGSRKADTWEWEVLPPETKATPAQLEPLFRWLARIMDNLFCLPGTKFRFGVDPIIGLFPGIGDSVSAVVSALALFQAARCGLPRAALARMSLNILINEVVGIIPGIGDAFSFWFKSNARNYQILRANLTAPHRARRSDWLFVVTVIVILFFVFVSGLLVSLIVLDQLLKLLGVR